jgi:hypothetical protein
MPLERIEVIDRMIEPVDSGAQVLHHHCCPTASDPHRRAPARCELQAASAEAVSGPAATIPRGRYVDVAGLLEASDGGAE